MRLTNTTKSKETRSIQQMTTSSPKTCPSPSLSPSWAFIAGIAAEMAVEYDLLRVREATRLARLLGFNHSQSHRQQQLLLRHRLDQQLAAILPMVSPFPPSPPPFPSDSPFTLDSAPFVLAVTSSARCAPRPGKSLLLARLLEQLGVSSNYSTSQSQQSPQHRIVFTHSSSSASVSNAHSYILVHSHHAASWSPKLGCVVLVHSIDRLKNLVLIDTASSSNDVSSPSSSSSSSSYYSSIDLSKSSIDRLVFPATDPPTTDAFIHASGDRLLEKGHWSDYPIDLVIQLENLTISSSTAPSKSLFSEDSSKIAEKILVVGKNGSIAKSLLLLAPTVSSASASSNTEQPLPAQAAVTPTALPQMTFGLDERINAVRSCGVIPPSSVFYVDDGSSSESIQPVLDLILEKLSNHISLQLQSHLCILNSISDTYSSIFAHYANQLGIVASCIDSIAQLCLHQSSSSLALLSASSPPSSSTSPSSSQPPLHPTSPFNFLHAQAILKCMKESMLYFTPDPILLHPSTSLKTLPPFIISQGYDLGLPASHHPNEYKAFRWALQAAATSRDPLSQFRLALRYRAALGTAFDESVGNKYLLVAAKGGCEAARAELLRLVELGHVDQALVNIFSSSSSSTTTSSSASAISSSEVTLLQHLHSKFSRSSSHSDNSFNEDSKMPVSLSLSAEALALSDKVARDGDWSVSCCHLVKQEHATVLQILLDGFKYIRHASTLSSFLSLALSKLILLSRLARHYMAADVRQQVDRLLDTMQSDIFSFASPLSSSSSSSTPPPPTSSDSFIVKAIRNDFDKILDIWVNKDLSYNTLLNECVIVEADDDNNKENKASYSDCDKKNDTNDQKSGQQAIEDQHQDKVDTDGVESLPPPPPLSCDSPSPPASPNTSKRHMEESTLRATQLLHHILLICHPLGENLELTATTLVRSWLNSRDEQPPLDASPASSSSLATFEALINKVINPSYLVSYGTPYIDDLVEAVTLTLAPLAENVWREKQFWNQKMEWAFNIHLLVAKADLKSMDHFSSTTSPSSLSSSSSASLHSSRKNPEDNILLLNTESRLAAAVTSRPESLVPYYLFRGLDSNWSACSKMVTLTSSNTVSSSSGTASTSSSTTNSIIDAASLSSIIGQTYIAIVNYKPANDMELLVKLGDSVEILGMFENDWTRICARNTRTGMDGVVPFSCLRPMKRSNSLPVSLPVVKIGGGGGDSSGVVGGPSVPTSGSGISRLGARYAVKSQSVSSSAAPSNSPVATLAGTLSSLSPPPPASSEDSIAKLVSTVISSSRGSFEKSGNAAKMFMSAASSTISTKKVEEKQMASYSIKGSNAWSGMMNQEPLMAFIYQGVVESVTKKETTKSQDFMDVKVIRSFANQLRESTDKFIHIPFSAYSVSPSLNSHAAQNVLQVVDDLAANMRSFSSSMHSLEGFYSPLMSDSEDSCRREIDALFSSVKQISRLARAVCSELSDALNGKKAMDLVSAILLILLGHMDDWKYFLEYSEHLPIVMAVIVSCKSEAIPEFDELKKLVMLPVRLFDVLVKDLSSMMSLVDKGSPVMELLNATRQVFVQLNAIITEFKCTAQSVASDTNNTIDYYLELGVSHFTSSCDSVQVQDIAKAIACWKSASYFARAQKEIIKEASIMSNILYASQRLIGAQAYPCFSSVWLGIWRQMYGLIKINAMAAASSSPSSSPASETWSGLITQILAHLVPEDAALPVLGHPQQNSASSNNVTPYTSCWMMQATTNVGNSYLQQGDACQACKWFIATLALCTHSLKFVPWISHGESWNSLYRREAAIAQVRCLISLSIAYGHNHLNQEVEASQAIVKAEIAFQGLMELIDTRSSEIIALEAALAAAVASIKAHQSRYYEAAVAQFKAFRLYEAIGDDVSQSTCKLDLSRSCLNIAMNIATCNWIENEDAHLANSIDAVKSVLVGVHQGEISGISSRSLLEEEYEYRLLTSGGGGIGGLVWKISRNGIIDKSIGLEFLQISRTLSSAASLNSSYAAATSEICKSIMMDVKRISAFSNLPLESSPTQRVSDCIYLAWSKMSVDPSRSITIIGQLLEGTSAELVADISPADKLYLRYIILYASAVLFVLKGGVDDDGASISSLKSAISILSMLSGLDVISADGDSAAVWLIDQVFHLKNIISSNVAAIHGLSLKSSCDLVTGLDSLLLYLQQVQLGDVYRVDEGENQQHRAQQHRANVCYVLRDHQLPESMVGSTSSNLLAKLWTSSACRVGVCISCVQMQQAGGLRTMGTVLTQQVSNSAPPSSAAQESEISTATASKSSSSLLPSATSLKLHFHSRRHHVGSGNRCKHVCEATVSSATSSSFVSEYTENLEAIPRSLIVPEKSTLTATPKPREARSSSLSLVNSANNTNGISNNNENNTRLSSYSVTLTSTEAIMSLMQRVSEADESMDPKLLAHLKQQLEDQILIFRHHIDKVSLLQHGGDRSFGSGVSQAGSASFGKGKSKDDDGTSADFVAANAHTAAALVSSSKITSSSPVLTTSSTILTTTTSMTESLDHSKQTPASAPESTHIFPSTPRTALSATSVPSPSHEHLPVYEL